MITSVAALIDWALSSRPPSVLPARWSVKVEVLDGRRTISELRVAEMDGEVQTSDRPGSKAEGTYAQYPFFPSGPTG